MIGWMPIASRSPSTVPPVYWRENPVFVLADLDFSTGLAVHPFPWFEPENTMIREGWVVCHVMSGLKVFPFLFPTKDLALIALKDIALLFDWYKTGSELVAEHNNNKDLSAHFFAIVGKWGTVIDHFDWLVDGTLYDESVSLWSLK
jgi:hypothetical protein